MVDDTHEEYENGWFIEGLVRFDLHVELHDLVNSPVNQTEAVFDDIHEDLTTSLYWVLHLYQFWIVV